MALGLCICTNIRPNQWISVSKIKSDDCVFDANITPAWKMSSQKLSHILASYITSCCSWLSAQSKHGQITLHPVLLKHISAEPWHVTRIPLFIHHNSKSRHHLPLPFHFLWFNYFMAALTMPYHLSLKAVIKSQMLNYSYSTDRRSTIIAKIWKQSWNVFWEKYWIYAWDIHGDVGLTMHNILWWMHCAQQSLSEHRLYSVPTSVLYSNL